MAVYFRCNVCDDPVLPDELREHLAGHYNYAWALDWVQVRGFFHMVESLEPGEDTED